MARARGNGAAVTAGLPTLDWPALYPVLIVTVACFACLLLDATPRGARPGILAATGVLGVAGAVGVSLLLWGGPATSFQGMLVVDGFALFLNVVIGGATALVLLLSVGYLPRLGVEPGEYYALILFATVGMMLMAAGTDLLVIFLALELMSLSLYVLAGTFRTRPEGNEAALKYFLLGAFASGFFLYGIALLYGATGTTNLERLGVALAAPGAARDPMVLAGLALLLVGFGFKTSAVPFHQWAPDVYQGAPTTVAALIATGSKAAAFGALLRVLVAMRLLQADWVMAFWVLAVLTMTVGNVVALVQSNVKRLLAYSSVAHVGYMLVGLAAGLYPGAPAVLFYLGVYAVASVGAFGTILLLEREGEEAVDLAAYGGLAARHPILAFGLTVFLLALIGMPPTAGFVGKFYLFSAAIQRGLVGLAVIAVLNSVVAAYYYLRLIVYMYMREPEGAPTLARVTPAASMRPPDVGLDHAPAGSLARPGPGHGPARGRAAPAVDGRRHAGSHAPESGGAPRSDQSLLERREGRRHDLRLRPGGPRRGRAPGGPRRRRRPDAAGARERPAGPRGGRRDSRRRRQGHGVPGECRRPAAGQRGAPGVVRRESAGEHAGRGEPPRPPGAPRRDRGGRRRPRRS